MNLKTLSPDGIIRKPLPVEDLLTGSVYYPACYDDGRPIKYCNTIWRKLGVNSFIYCDYAMSESYFLSDIRKVLGYHVLAHRSVSPDEYMPSCWNLELSKEDKGYYWNCPFGNTREFRPFAHWVVFERDACRTDAHGPHRFSLLYIGAEGLATFQQLYVSRGIAPRMLCFIQCWGGMALNWTNFTGYGGSFAKTLRKNPECVPEWICTGSHDEIDGVMRLKGTGYLGIECLRYTNADYLKRHFCSPPVKIRNGVMALQSGGRNYLALSLACMCPVLYDITGSPHDVDTLVNNLILRERKAFSADDIINGWAGFKPSVWRDFSGHDIPELDLSLVDRGVHPNGVVASAINVVDAAAAFYGRERIRMCTERILSALRYAEDILAKFKGTDTAAEAKHSECKALLRRLRRLH